MRCDIKDEQVKLTIVVPNYEVTKVDDGIWSAMLDEDFDKHPPYTVNETWSLNVCFPFAKKDGTKKTSSKALVMSHGYVEVLMNRIQMALYLRQNVVNLTILAQLLIKTYEEKRILSYIFCLWLLDDNGARLFPIR